jgi:CRP/FNR family transcriptional regulator
MTSDTLPTGSARAPAGWPGFPWLGDVRPAPGEPGAVGDVLDVPAGTVLFDVNQPCGGFPIVLEGEVRVSQSSVDGRTLELYRVGAGEICLVSAACLFGDHPMTGRGETLRDSRLLLVPPETFDAWMSAPSFRRFVLGMFADRMVDLTGMVDAVAFHRLDERLAAALLGHGQELRCTHQQLAEQLGTVREMVTRVLRRFEREGWVALSRERIRILDSVALRSRAAGAR